MTPTVLAIALTGVVLIVLGSAAWAGIRAAPWVPLRSRDIRRLLTLAELKPGERVVDLGCGDGRVLTLAAAEFGATATGYEISVLPFFAATLRRLVHAKRAKISLQFRDFFSVSLTPFDVVVCFLTPSAMNRLRTKFVHELHPGARVVSYAFSLGDLPGVAAFKPSPNLATVYLYRAQVINNTH